MPRRALLPACCLLLLTAPTAARADAGTPLIWAGMLHLVFLNFGIGVLEGTVLARLFRLPRLRTQGLLIPANYLSMAAGWVLPRAAWAPLERRLPGPAPLDKGAALLVILGVGSWAASVLLEWPFCALALRGGGRNWGGWRQSLGASAVAQTASYALLVPFYLLISPISLYTVGRMEHSPAFVGARLATVYYISPVDGAVWRVRTDGADRERVATPRWRDSQAVLYVLPDAASGHCDVGALQCADGCYSPTGPQSTVLVSGVPCGHGLSEADARSPSAFYYGFGRPVDLRPGKRHEWGAFADFWAGRGLRVEHREPPAFGDDRASYTLAFETPFEDWPWRSVTLLPGDLAVAQLGTGTADAQIVVLDLKTRQVGFLALGRGPAVVPQAKQGRSWAARPQPFPRRVSLRASAIPRTSTSPRLSHFRALLHSAKGAGS